MKYSCVIIGGGAAGIYAALKLKEEGTEDLLIIDMNEDLGGILNLIIESHGDFGFKDYTGVELADDLKRQVILHGIDYITGAYVLSVSKDRIITAVSPSKGIFKVEADSVIIATGGSERPRGILNLTSNRAAGIYSVGTARKFTVENGYLVGRNPVIYGDDFTGLYLARLLITEGAGKVTIAAPEKEINFPNSEVEEFLKLNKVDIRLGVTIKELEGTDRVTAVILEDEKGDTETVPCDSLILSVGLYPSRKLFTREFRKNDLGVFITGNAKEITYRISDIRESSIKTAEDVLEYLKNSGK